MNNLFDSIYKPDVLSCLADLSNDEVLTPPEVANQMLDLLPKEIWSDPNIKILDPACKSGVFLREAAKRFLDGEKDIYPNLEERIEHIFKEQLYGIAITEMTSLMSRRSLYCSKYANSPFSIVDFYTPDGNIKFHAIQHSWSGNTCMFCGAAKSQYNRLSALESHAYEFIHTLKPEEIINMRFDVVIGNPPYQLSDGGNKNSAKPIYHLFVEQAKKLNPRYISMIIPARWYAGGKGLEEFRNEMLSDERIVRLVDFSNAKDCFPGISLGGGVCYFLWDKDKNGKCLYTNIHDSTESTQLRKLNEFPVFVRYNEALSIIHKVQKKSKTMVSDVMGGRNPFGFESFAKGNESKTNYYNCTLHYSGGMGYVAKDEIKKGYELLDKYKVMISRATSEHAGEPDSSGKYGVLSVIRVLKPFEVCTDSYLLGLITDNETEAVNYAQYARTKFYRFLVLQSVTSISLSKEKFSFVPQVNCKEAWDDEKLYRYFELTEDEVDFIESMIKPKAPEAQ